MCYLGIFTGVLACGSVLVFEFASSSPSLSYLLCCWRCWALGSTWYSLSKWMVWVFLFEWLFQWVFLVLWCGFTNEIFGEESFNVWVEFLGFGWVWFVEKIIWVFLVVISKHYFLSLKIKITKKLIFLVFVFLI